ncbi:MAG: hypothetical protein CMI00_03590 [Oceanospirillaceae bacterium]|nr:hypothetical protein [Oceanospirillaceae bacterium]
MERSRSPTRSIVWRILMVFSFGVNSLPDGMITFKLTTPSSRGLSTDTSYKLIRFMDPVVKPRDDDTIERSNSSVVSCLLLKLTQIFNNARAATRLTRHTGITPVQNQPVVCVHNELFRHQPHQPRFHFIHVLAGCYFRTV